MNRTETRNTLFFAAALVAFLTAARLLPHVANVAPVAAGGLFAGAYLGSRRWALAVPVLAMVLSDVLLYLLQGLLPWNPTGLGWMSKGVDYAALVVPVLLGYGLRSSRPAWKVAGFSLVGSVAFFLLSNLGVFLFGGLYPLTPAGLLGCYTMAIPFYQNTLLGDLLFSGLLFGGAWALQARMRKARQMA